LLVGWTVNTDFYSALGDSLTSVALAWLMDFGLGRIKVVKLWAKPAEEVPHLSELSTGQKAHKLLDRSNSL